MFSFNITFVLLAYFHFCLAILKTDFFAELLLNWSTFDRLLRSGSGPTSYLDLDQEAHLSSCTSILDRKLHTGSKISHHLLYPDCTAFSCSPDCSASSNCQHSLSSLSVSVRSLVLSYFISCIVCMYYSRINFFPVFTPTLKLTRTRKHENTFMVMFDIFSCIKPDASSL
jgi:hypothetical protein